MLLFGEVLGLASGVVGGMGGGGGRGGGVARSGCDAAHAVVINLGTVTGRLTVTNNGVDNRQ